MRDRLIRAAAQISRNNNVSPSTPLVAIRKLFAQERRDRSLPGNPQVGWKSGELSEFLNARSCEERAEEWGDVGYYIA